MKVYSSGLIFDELKKNPPKEGKSRVFPVYHVVADVTLQVLQENADLKDFLFILDDNGNIVVTLK